MVSTLCNPVQASLQARGTGETTVGVRLLPFKKMGANSGVKKKRGEMNWGIEHKTWRTCPSGPERATHQHFCQQQVRSADA